MSHTISQELIAQLPIVLQSALHQDLSLGQPYAFIPKAAMKAMGMQFVIQEVTAFDDDEQVVVASIALSWSQDPDGVLCAYNKAAQDAKAQRQIWIKNYSSKLPYSWFTPEQLEQLKDRSASSEYQNWVAENKDSEKYILFPKNLRVYGVTDIAFIYTPEKVKDNKPKPLSSIGIAFSLVEDNSFIEGEFEGKGFSTKGEAPVKTDKVYDKSKSAFSAIPALKQVSVTPEMMTAAMPVMTSAVPVVAPAGIPLPPSPHQATQVAPVAMSIPPAPNVAAPVAPQYTQAQLEEAKRQIAAQKAAASVVPEMVI